MGTTTRPTPAVYRPDAYVPFRAQKVVVMAKARRQHLEGWREFAQIEHQGRRSALRELLEDVEDRPGLEGRVAKFERLIEGEEEAEAAILAYVDSRLAAWPSEDTTLAEVERTLAREEAR